MSEWQPIETLPENTLALLYCAYDPIWCVGSFHWIEEIEWEEVSESHHPSGRRRILQEKKTRQREWEAPNWSATHWMALPEPPRES